MEVFDLTRGTTTGTVRVPAKAGETAQFKIRSTKAKKVNGKSQTPERINFTYSYANQAVVRASWKEDPSNAELYIVTLLVIRTNTANTEDNTTVPFTQNESGNVLNLTVVQEAAATTYEYFIISKPQAINAPYGGTKTTLTIYSYRDTKVDGKVTNSDLIDFTTRITSDSEISDTWIFTKKAVNDALSYSLEIEISPNSGGARTGTITLTQASSGKTITINIYQAAAGVIVQKYVLTGPTFPNILFSSDGGTQTVEVESYVLYSDGSKVAEVPYIDSKPTWLTVEITPKSQIIGNTKYSVKVTAAPNIETTYRRGNLVLRQGAVEGKELTFVVSQGIPVTDIEIKLTITNLTDGTGALFGEFEVPNSNSVLDYFAFNILGTSHKFTYKKSTGLVINLSTPGKTDIAYIGDIIRLYTFDSNSTRWVYRTQFALPSSDTTINIPEY